MGRGWSSGRIGSGPPRGGLLITLLALVVWFPTIAWAHPPVATSAVVRIRSSGQVEISLNHDVLAFALNDTSQNIPDGPMLELLNGPEEELAAALRDAAERFETLCVLTSDGARVPVKVTVYPGVKDLREHQARRPGYPLPIKQDLFADASVPSTARGIAIRFPEMLGIVVLTVSRPGMEPVALPLEPNELSPAFEISLTGGREGGAEAGGEERSATTVHGTGWWSVFLRFTALGFTHIIPGGPDHALFVLGLFLLSPRVKPVVLQISWFTLAHTLTLTLTSLQIIGLPSSIVEPAIAASIAFVGIENLLTREVHAWRSGVAFIFGLVHGMGVATAFNEAGFPKGQLVQSLAAFTVGVEGGHILVLVLAFLMLGWTRSREWYRGRVAIPLSVAISVIALFWLVSRLVWR